MKQEEYPILEFDAASRALIEPSEQIEPIDAPQRCVLCFFREVIEDLREDDGLRQIECLHSEMGEHPLYEADMGGRRLAIFQPAVTSAFAAAFLDELIALGCRKFIACGSAGVLRPEIAPGTPIIVTAAVRDEGASYHYLPPSREVESSPEAVAAIERVLTEQGLRYLTGKTWTTDGFYRETRDKVELRRREGCLTVEMEAAGFLAVARFRNVVFGQILYAGDDVSGEVWDRRRWKDRTEIRGDLFGLAAAACLLL